ncbi:hypothetical protein CAOG_02806 [Capsaspora owczarzaki ATCC 30864]|uniref:Uncharacterized protein n=1 Tax=Capsaspora owczarzaki (strain ATCC 30864) TaxID=595528 RepID=A0A0D2WLY7_CAPO3|nr:hypothetical protein CAOG_02806 [Capsaspora owczarzaki ATCC 30864]KJE91710.1 hypothetical protein CAOG_002806 [Capsaspora owczarzaki ATCC 30864]|eukprot:XP_004348619.1 hypothetical protein CAOG_02806 [Capsaspora owczarzaki ATCC 30864]
MTDAVSSFDFVHHPGWQEYFSRLEGFSAHGPTPSQLLKLQRKWYKQHIDPSYEAPAAAAAAPTTTTDAPSSSSSPSPSSSSSKAHHPRRRRTPAPRADSTNNGGSSSAGSASSGSSTAAPAARRSLVQFAIANKLQLIAWIANLLCLINVLAFIVPIGMDPSPISYYKVFRRGAVAYIVMLYQRHGLVFSRNYLNSIIPDENFAYIMYCVVFSFADVHAAAVLPMAIFALYGFATFTPNVASAILPQNLRSTIVPRIRGLVARLTAVGDQAKIAAARLELILVPILFIGLFSGEFLPLISYANFLNLRYVQSAHTRRLLSDLKILGFQLTGHPRCPPIIGAAFVKLVGLLERMDPNRR